SNQCQVDMTSARSVTATFAIDLSPPPPDPPPAAPTAKRVDLSANRGRVQFGRRVRFTVGVEPCAGHVGETVQLTGRNRTFAGILDAQCIETFRVRMRRTTTFRAISPQQDADHLADTSNPIRVRVLQRD
ncbi:MAG: hypothetical protein M3135_01190, partial [Actinomycetota bacterium]|nr:hypothetical protein [Actinomycetota bacterium]